jgi:GYF domain 2
MAENWYYAHDANRVGPFSDRQMKNLALSGTILGTDTVWKQGVEKGVLASRVKNLFSLQPAIVIVPVQIATDLAQVLPRRPLFEMIVPVVELTSSPSPTIVAAIVAPAILAAAPLPPKAIPKPARKGRAVATKGADIVSQDGVKARYRRKCTVCGNKDLAVQTVVITNRTTNTGYYCPKCKKKRDVTIQCTTG